MKAANRKILPWGVAVLTSCCWAYSLSARYTDFFFAPKSEKIAILSFLLILSSVLSAWLFLVVLNPILKITSVKKILLSAGFSFLVILLIFTFTYELPPFPEKHLLTITPLLESNPLSDGSVVELSSMSTVSLPAQKSKRIPVSQLALIGMWQGSGNEFGIKTSDGPETSASFERFIQAGMAIEFLTGPHSGMVQVIWDDEEQILDLYSPSPATNVVYLDPHLNLKRADITRKVLVAGVLITDFIGIAIIVFSGFLLITEISSTQKLIIRKPGLLFLCFVLVAAMQLVDLKVNKIVVFENPQIEALVREILEKPIGGISQHQLLTIVSLDASDRNLTSLIGIDLMPNLIELDLKNNQISNLEPLKNLKHLKKLNLRNNDLTDLSPLALLTNLTYLNIHSNLIITSIQPLSGLENLRTLIMAYVPIGDEITLLENFKHLVHLNLRGCDVTDLEPIFQLENLEYLNLHSNPEISSTTSLKNLSNLKALILANIPVGDSIETLSNLPQIEYLNLRKANLTDIQSLTKLTRLEYLNLHSNPEIQSIEPIRAMIGLRTLILEDVPIGSQIEILNGFHDLRKLNIRNSGVTDISVIGRLMTGGALQDNTKAGVEAEIDIRDNFILNNTDDQYKSLRPYWDNISVRQPFALPFFSKVSKVNFSKPAGIYEDNFLLELFTSDPATRIHYTLDGSEPTSISPIYSGPIPIESRSGEPNKLSAVEAVAADWNKPKAEIAKAVVIRAAAINAHTGMSSEIMTQTYFVGKEYKGKYTLPVLSLVTDAQNLFDKDSGIYILGNSYAEHVDEDITEDERQVYANYNKHGRGWERPISIEVFESDGMTKFSQNGGVRIHGGGSRRYPQKTLRIYAGSEYALRETFDYPLFSGRSPVADGQSEQVYKTFLLRNAGQDYLRSIFRDAFVQLLANEMDLDSQASRPVIVFLNGEYWGIYTLQERYDEFFLQNHYAIPPEGSVILRQGGELFRGKAGDEAHYSEMLRYISEYGLRSQQHYRYIQTQMDVTNYMDYLIAEIYAGNDDWPDNNVYLWRMKTETYDPNAPFGQDGRWRWMLFDLDFGFGLKGGTFDIEQDTIEVAKLEGWSGFLFRSLLENAEFRSEFAQRFLDQIESTYAPGRVIAILDQMKAELQPEIEEHLLRWSSDPLALENWEREVNVMREFALKRPDTMRELVKKHFAQDLK